MKNGQPEPNQPWQGKCGRRKKSCRQCRHRFMAGDQAWTCPACGADRHCLNDAADGLPGGACRIHGGRSLKGPACPAYRGKGFSKYLPAGLAEKFEEAKSDEGLLRLRDEAALLRVRQIELAGRLDTGESQKAWTELADAWHEFESASRAGDTAQMQVSLADIGRLIKHGAGRDAAWRELVKLAHDRASIVRTEAEVLHRMSQGITLAEAELLFAAIAQAVLSEVADKAIQSRIVARFAAIRGRPRLIDTTAAPVGGNGEEFDAAGVEENSMEPTA